LAVYICFFLFFPPAPHYKIDIISVQAKNPPNLSFTLKEVRPENWIVLVEQY